jgi:hypothetical protein
MSTAELSRFLAACANSRAMLERYEPMALPDLIFSARCYGYDIQPGDFGTVIGGLEVRRIIDVDKQGIGADSTLWRHMWGRSRLAYVVDELWAKTDDTVREALLTGGQHD